MLSLAPLAQLWADPKEPKEVTRVGEWQLRETLCSQVACLAQGSSVSKDQRLWLVCPVEVHRLRTDHRDP